MKLSEMTDDEETQAWLDSMKLSDKCFVKNGEVHVKTDGSGGSVFLNHHDLEKIPVQFAEMRVNFLCHDNKLKTLKGSPPKCQDFDADHNDLTTLEGGPKSTIGSYTVFDNKLISLKGSPEFVGDDFDCQDNLLKKIDGGPKMILGSWDLNDNHLETLHDIHKYCQRCNGEINIGGNPIKKSILGLVMIEGLERVGVKSTDPKELKQAIRIVNKYLTKGRKGVLACQEELIDAGLDEYAEL